MKLDEIPHDRQTQSQPAVLPADRFVGLPEAFEHMRQKLRIDAGSGVTDANADVAGLSLVNLDGHRAGGRGELDRVGQEIPDHLLQAFRISVNHAPGTRRGGSAASHLSLSATGRTASSAAPTTEPTSTGRTFNRTPPVMMRDTSRMSATSCAWSCALRSMTSRARRELAASILPSEQPRPAQDRVERRAQLVREHGEKLVLRAIGRLCLAAGLRLAAEQVFAFTLRFTHGRLLPHSAHELADLGADSGHRSQKVRIRRQNAPIEALDDAEHFVAEPDRKSKRAMQTGLARQPERAGKLGSSTTLGIQWGSPDAQTRPGRPMPAMNSMDCDRDTNAGARVRSSVHIARQRSR